jgi:hypothetical protein
MSSLPTSPATGGEDSHHHGLHPAKMLHKLAQPLRHKRWPRENGVREAIDVDAETPAKRLKGSGAFGFGTSRGDDVICVDVEPSRAVVPSDQPPRVVGLHALKVLGLFRVNAKQLGQVSRKLTGDTLLIPFALCRKKNKYQILYFPLTEPLTEQERASRRIVVSEKAC